MPKKTESKAIKTETKRLLCILTSNVLVLKFTLFPLIGMGGFLFSAQMALPLGRTFLKPTSYPPPFAHNMTQETAYSPLL